MRRKQSSTRGSLVTASERAGPSPPRKRFGQNFLIDVKAIRRIVAALDPKATDNVLEIGPGRGALTAALLEAVPRIAAIEIDRDLGVVLRERFREDRLRLIEADVLDVLLSELAGGRPLLIAGNLPYNISKPLAMKLVRERSHVTRAVLMFQSEVADRLTAVPGSGSYGPLSVLAGQAYAIERLFDLAPRAFRPPPLVTSTVTRWTRREVAALDDSLVAPLQAVLRASFARRRQTIKRNLRAALPRDEAAEELLARAGIDGSLRAERVPAEGFLALARAWPG